jgi:hypothetical protein
LRQVVEAIGDDNIVVSNTCARLYRPRGAQ